MNEAEQLIAGLCGDTVALVTGAARGIGRSTGKRLAQAGAAVMLADLDGSACAGLAEEIVAAGGRAEAVAVDVTDESALEDAVVATQSRLGRIDALVANAGVLHLENLVATETEDWQRVVDVNLTGAFLSSRTVARALVEQGSGGSIVVMSSAYGRRGGEGNAAYSATKFGVVGIVESAAAELGPHGIRVNAVCPGPVDTQMAELLFEKLARASDSTSAELRKRAADRLPLRRLATPGDVSDVVLFLVSPLSRYVTGQSIVVDGGAAVA